MAEYSYTIHPTPPFRLDLTAWILRRRPDNLVDRWDGGVYRRVLLVNDNPVEVTVNQDGTLEIPSLQVLVSGANISPDIEPQITAYLERLLGFNIDLDNFYQFTEGHPDLNHLAVKFRGSKPPRFSTFFETLVNAISCQQLSLDVGIKLLNRLAQNYAPAYETHNGLFYAFPRPKDIINADVEALRQIGFSYQKGRYLVNLARLIVDQQINLDEIDLLPDEAAVAQLRQIKGVGRWTAEYFLLRGLGRTHLFPGDDVGARNHLQRWLGIPERLDYNRVHQALGDWGEYGGLVYFHLLLKSLAEKGNLPEL